MTTTGPSGGGRPEGRPRFRSSARSCCRVYEDDLVGRAPRFPREIEHGIDQYLALQAGSMPPAPEPTELQQTGAVELPLPETRSAELRPVR